MLRFSGRSVLGVALLASLSACSAQDSNDVETTIGSTQEALRGHHGRGHRHGHREPRGHEVFNRLATFPVCLQLDPTCDTNTRTTSEIAAVSQDGMTLVYSDALYGAVGFVDITDPATPLAAGIIALPGEPTSVGVVGSHALVAVNTSADYVSVAGELHVIDIASRTTVRVIDLGGQPDSVAISPDGNYAAVVIENERDEELNDGDLPQLPAGKLVVVSLSGAPAGWTTTDVDLTGLAGVEPTDPEPEFVDINAHNVAVVTLQENNSLALVDLASASVLNSFWAGTVDLTQIDKTEEEALISQTQALSNIPREPDGVAWISSQYFATADEGDWNGGSRGFTVFDTAGNVVWTSGNTTEHLTARIGHYPDSRSKNKGAELENVEVGTFGGTPYLFVNSERASVVLVYDVTDPTNPVYKQVLPAGLGPEGGLAIPSRNLFVAASEEDSRGDVIRSALNLYRFERERPHYPTLLSADRPDGTPIPWAALSGLVADGEHTLFSIEDSYFKSNRIFEIDTSSRPPTLVEETRIIDSNDVFASIPTVTLADDSVDDDDESRSDVFDQADLAAMINADKTVNIDPEGIALARGGGFWVASEGAGTVGDAANPVNSLNFLFKTDTNGVIEQVVTLPPAVNAMQLRFGFEGVAEYEGKLYVAFQRKWGSDPGVRIGIYDVAHASWEFAFYNLDPVVSQNGGWVGLSELTSLGNGKFLVIERDNQGGPDAAIKRLYKIDLKHVHDGDTVSKALVRDLMGDLTARVGLIPEKIEGSAITRSGNVWIVNDNDGVEDNSGETELINLGRL